MKIRMLDYFLEQFNEKGEPYLLFLCKSTLAKRIILYKYQTLEPMPLKERNQLYRYVIGLMPELTNPEKKQAAEIVYTIGNLIG